MIEYIKVIVIYSKISNVLLQRVIIVIMVKKSILNMYRIYKNAKETLGEYKASNSVMHSSRGIDMIGTKVIL